ncbi:MAG: hypothetical protein J7L55_03920, partial [Desulfurococcales archaeon]|nr:hypothetical protein [Desulfurococcales archaeon]
REDIPLIMSHTPTRALLVGVWDIIKGMSSRELIPQLILLSAFVLGLRGVDLRIVTGVAALSIPFVISRKSYVGLALTYIFLPLPVIGLTNTVTDIGSVPHFTFSSIPVSSPLYPLIMTVFYVTWMLSALISGGVMTLLAGHIAETRSFRDLLKHVLLSLIPTYLFIVGQATTEYLLFRGDVEALLNTYFSTYALATALAFTGLTIEDSVLFWKEKSALKSEIIGLINKVKEKAQHNLDALKAFEAAELADSKLKELKAKTINLLNELSTIEKEVRRRLGYEELTIHLTTLKKDEAFVNTTENLILSKYGDTVKLLRKALPYIRMYDNAVLDLVSRELELIAEVTSAKDIPSRLKALERTAKRVCTSLVTSLNKWFDEIKLFLGIRFVDTPLKCDEGKLPFREISELLTLSQRVSETVNPKISEAYRKLMTLKRNIGELLLTSHDVLQTRSFMYKSLNTLYEGLRDVQETFPSPYIATVILNKKASYIKVETPKVLNALLKDVERVKAELGTYEVRWVSNIVDLVKDIEKSLNKLMSDALNLLDRVKERATTYEVIEHLHKALPEIFREGRDLVTDSILIEVRATLIPMVFDYLDWKIAEAGDEGIPVNELPFTKEALLWFLRLYVTSRQGVTVKKGYLVKEVE